MFCKLARKTENYTVIVTRGRVYKGLVYGENYIGQELPSTLGGWDSSLEETIEHAYIILKYYKDWNKKAEWTYIVGDEILI